MYVVGQFSKYSPKVRVKRESEYVFQEHELRSNKANALVRLRPEVAVVFRAFSTACNTKGLAGEATCKHVNHTSMCFGVPFTVECTDIAVDGGLVEEAVGNALRDNFLAELIFLDIPSHSPSQLFTA
jgi:hypothetical protein